MNAQSSDNNVNPTSYQQLMIRYERLMDITCQLNSTLDLDALLKRIVTAASELTETEQASILLVDPDTGELRFEAASNLSRAEMEAIPVPLRGSLAGWVVTHGEPVLVEDARSDSRWFARVDKTIKFTTRNVLAVPMNLQNRPVGVVEAINKRNDQPWTEDDVNTLSALANQAATAIQNARLFQQSDFIAEIVHELRTPLAALKASTALLLRPTLPEGMRQEIVLTMQQETERLTALTTDFLDLARLESGRTRLQTRVFDIRALLEECVTLVAPRAAERDIDIEIRGDPLRASADRDKIKQVLLNLLTNAIKYNREHGSIYCTIDVQRDSPPGSSAGCLLISVQDTGNGINEEDQKRVFEKFFRVADTSGQVTGTGLGLSIAKRIVEAHDCDMWLRSELGVGTTFYFTLPLADNASPHDRHPPGSAEAAVSGR
jgi:signal transduction histidine kinase